MREQLLVTSLTYAVMAGPLREEISVVDPLGSGEDLLPSHKHVVGVGVLLTTHTVKQRLTNTK
jgi:hypothetical protein